MVQNNIYYESEDAIKYYNISYRASEGISLPENCKADKNIFFCKGNISDAENFVSAKEDGDEQNSIADPLIEDIAKKISI